MRAGVRPDTLTDRLGLLTPLVPRPLFEGFLAFAMARTLMAATSLGVFAALEERPDDAAGLARRLEIDAAGADILLTALLGLGYVDHADGRYRNAPVAQRYLRPGPRSVEDWTASFSYDMWETFGQLEDALRTGRHQAIHDKPANDGYWERYMRGLFQIARLSAPAFARLVPARAPRRLLDLAGGHGAFSMAMCERHDGLRATIVELEGSARVGRRLVAEHGHADRVEFVVGDLFAIDLGGPYDVAMVNNLLHHLPPERCVELLRRARGALRPGGTMAVLEFDRPAEGERGEQIAVLTALLFHVSSGARTHEPRTVAGFLAEAGFGDVRIRRHPELAGSALLLGRA